MQGLERDRFALLTKTHHAAVDGIAGVDIGTVLFDLEPIPEPAPVEDGWQPRQGAGHRRPARPRRGRARGSAP